MSESSANASAPIAKPQPQEARIEKQSAGEVNIGFAAHLLGVDSEEIVWLCKTGALHARRTLNGFWMIDEVFLRWYQANPDLEHRVAGCESRGCEEPHALPAPALQALPPTCPPDACEAHFERRDRIVPAYRANLCRACYSGRPLPVKFEPDAT